MTIKQLEKVGVYYVGTKLRPDRFEIDSVGEVKLYKPYSMQQVYSKIEDYHYEMGRENGLKAKANEIKRALNIEID